MPTRRWPYAAMAQRELGAPVEALRCGLLFAGIVRKDDSLYSPRTDLLGVLREKLVERFTVRTGTVNDRMQAADVAASADIRVNAVAPAATTATAVAAIAARRRLRVLGSAGPMSRFPSHSGGRAGPGRPVQLT